MTDGGPFHPQMRANSDGSEGTDPRAPGLSLRDWFAGQALAGLMATRIGDADDAAAIAYQVADALLVQRNRPTGA